MTLRAGARPFVPVAHAHVVECATTTAYPKAAVRETRQALGVGDKLIQDLATRMDGGKRSSSARHTIATEKVKASRRSSKTAVAKPGEHERCLRTSWRKLVAAGLFCPCCVTLSPCPFHAVESDGTFSSDLREADALVQTSPRRTLRKTWEAPCLPRATSSSRQQRVLPPPPTVAPPPPPPGLEADRTHAVEKRYESWKGDGDRCVERNNLPSWLLDDASTDVSHDHASSEVSSTSGLSSRTRRPPRQNKSSDARSNWSSSGKEMEWLPYRSAVWPNSGPRRHF